LVKQLNKKGTNMLVYNKQMIPWKNLCQTTKDEIAQQEELGATIQIRSSYSREWLGTNNIFRHRHNDIYRIKPGTEFTTLQPEDEQDLSKLTKPAGMWHPATTAAMSKVPLRDRQRYSGDFKEPWYTPHCTTFAPNSVYRVKPVPVPLPNLIDRETDLFKYPSSTLIALTAAHYLIQTMEGGDPVFRKVYEDAIK
jgi:hypothetical protein